MKSQLELHQQLLIAHRIKALPNLARGHPGLWPDWTLQGSPHKTIFQAQGPFTCCEALRSLSGRTSDLSSSSPPPGSFPSAPPSRKTYVFATLVIPWCPLQTEPPFHTLSVSIRALECKVVEGGHHDCHISMSMTLGLGLVGAHVFIQ